MPTSTSQPHPVRLLVSVRDVTEAHAAIAGGCQILDIKDPRRGSLGMASLDVIRAIVDESPSRLNGRPATPMSAALGEIVEWTNGDVPRLPTGLSFAKLGPAGLTQTSNWRDVWKTTHRKWSRLNPHIAWIAVAYADWSSAHAPSPSSIIDFATRNGFVGVLVDTMTKSHGSLTSWMSSDECRQFVEQARLAGLTAAIAGRLSSHELEELLPAVSPDIVAVRSAACTDHNRGASVCEDRVQNLVSQITRVTSPIRVVRS